MFNTVNLSDAFDGDGNLHYNVLVSYIPNNEELATKYHLAYLAYRKPVVDLLNNLGLKDRADKEYEFTLLKYPKLLQYEKLLEKVHYLPSGSVWAIHNRVVFYLRYIIFYYEYLYRYANKLERAEISERITDCNKYLTELLIY